MLLNAILESGFECSDPDSFHSSVHGGFRNRVHVDPREPRRTVLELTHGALAYTRRDTADSTCFDVEVLEDAWLYDLVCRWVFPGSVAARGELAGELVPRGSLLYHQHACARGVLGDVSFDFVGAESLPGSMQACLYLRCEAAPEDPTGFVWIVHARALARPDEPLWLKGTDGHASPFRGHPVEAQVLARRRERAAPIYETQVQAHTRLAAGTRCRVGLAICPSVQAVRP